MTPLLEVNHLKKHFAQGRSFLGPKREPVYAVNDVSFTVGRRETVGVVGESGCGKTTLGRSILRLTEPTAGGILFDGADIRALDSKALRKFRGRMQIVFQDSTATLDPRWTIGRTLKEGILLHTEGITDTMAEKEADHLLEVAGLPLEYKSKYPHELSGGQRQRIGIAKAISVKPEFIVADEPVSALDVSVQAQILNLLQSLRTEYELSYLFISHDLSVVKFISDRICVMYLGRIVEIADTDLFFKKPLHPYAHTLLSAVPDIRPRERRYVVTEQKEIGEGCPTGCSFSNRCPHCDQHCIEIIPELREVQPGHFAACHKPLL